MIKFVTNILQNRKKHAIKTKWLLFFLSKYKQVRISANIFNKENVTCFLKMRSIAILFCHRISGHCNGSIGSYNKKGKVLQGDRYGRNSPMSLGRLLIQFHKLEAVSAPLLLSPLRLNRKVCAVSGSFYIGKPETGQFNHFLLWI